MKMLLPVIFLCSSTSLFANLGDTIDQCKTRYGQSTGNASIDQIVFNRGHITIMVHVRNGRSIREDFAPESGSSLSVAQIAQILAENVEGSVWEIIGETPVAQTYLRKDGKA